MPVVARSEQASGNDAPRVRTPTSTSRRSAGAAIDEPVLSPYLHAARPADLPIVQLPAMALTPSVAVRGLDQPVAPAPTPSAEVLTSRPIAAESSSAAPGPADPTVEVADSTELPLSGPPPAGAESRPVGLGAPLAGPGSSSGHPGPLTGGTGGHYTTGQRVSEPSGTTGPGSRPLPLAAKPAEGTAPTPRSRSGLGAPISAVPTTASSFDMTDLSRTARGRARLAAISALGVEQFRNQFADAPRPNNPVARPITTSDAKWKALESTWSDLPMVRSVSAEGPIAHLEPLEPRPVPVPAGPDPAVMTTEATTMAPITGLRRSLLDLDPPAPADLPVPSAPASTSEGRVVRSQVGQQHGVDLSQVPVDRSAAGARSATDIKARAYTTNRGIVIPAEVGTLESGPGAAVLAHELTHMAQRVRLGADVPDEQSPAGQALEVQALQAELALAPPPVTRAGVVEAEAPVSRIPGLVGDRPSTGGQAGGGPSPLPVATAPTRAPDAATLTEAIRQLSPAQIAPFGGAYAAGSTSPVFGAAAPAAPPAMAGAGVQRAPEPDPSPSPSTTTTWKSASPSAKPAKPSDKELAQLAAWLYPLISFRIRSELRENRERAGLLTETYRRW